MGGEDATWWQAINPLWRQLSTSPLTIDLGQTLANKAKIER